MASYTIQPTLIGASASLSPQLSFSGSSILEIDESISTGVTDDDIVLAIDVSAVKLFYIVSDAAVTVETNATDATGGNTLTLVANQPYFWHTGSYDTFKLTADVTIAYITNASGSTANLKIRVIQDATP